MTQDKETTIKWWNWIWDPGGSAQMENLTIQLHSDHCSLCPSCSGTWNPQLIKTTDSLFLPAVGNTNVFCLCF